MKLISMTDFVLEQEIRNKKDNYPFESDEYFNKCVSYAELLKQPLDLGMFVPCDDYGNMLFNPESHNYSDINDYTIDNALYFKYKQQVLFKGYKVVHNTVIDDKGNYLDTSRLKGRNIESLIGCDLELTENAIKKYNLK